MLRAQVIAEVAAKQKANILGRSPGMSRLGRLGNVPAGFLSVVTGVRRCGKSTLMEQQMRLAPDSAFYLNFESTALAGLELKDAGRIDRAIDAVGARWRETSLFRRSAADERVGTLCAHQVG